MFLKKRLISAEEEVRLMEAIQLAELKTSGEIRVHLAKKRKTDAVKECKTLFTKLKMNETKDRNGILFYLAIQSKSFAVWGDEGIHKKVSDEFWQSISNCAISYFKQGQLVTGLEKSIELCGEKLKLHFPIELDDKNELSNEISY